MALVFFGALLALLPLALAIAVMIVSIMYLDTNEPITLEPHPVVGDATSSSET